MSYLFLIILCLVQGIAEFLPISSSGHLLLVFQLFNQSQNVLLISLFLHLATLLAVVLVYKNIIFNLIKKPFQPLTYKLILSTFLTVIMALIYKKFVSFEFEIKIYGFCFLITAILLFISFIIKKHQVGFQVGEISTKSAVAVGIVQGFAVLPGLSRSGCTIASLMLFGNDENKSAEYSFLLSIPIIVGGFVLELCNVQDFGALFSTISVFQCLFAFVFTFFIAFVSLKITLKLLKNNKFVYFSIYLTLLGFFVIAYNFIF